MDDLSWEAGLSKKHAERYSRQILVNDFGVKGQKGLLNSKVLILGAGGLGCPVGIYLAGAGIGTIGIVDYDTVSIDNLHRQVAHAELRVGKLKVDSLKETILRYFITGTSAAEHNGLTFAFMEMLVLLGGMVFILCKHISTVYLTRPPFSSMQSLNSSVNVETHNTTMDSETAMKIVKEYDIVCDCSDNAATRYLINDVCVILNKPLVSGSALRWDGQLSVYHYGEDCPCYRCLFPSPPDPSTVTNCSEGGVLGPIVGVIGSMQALEVIKIAGGLSSSFSGKMMLYNGREGKTRQITLRKKDKNCAVCGDTPTITKPIDYVLFCGAGAHDKTESIKLLDPSQRISVEDYRNTRRLAKPVLLDTRPPLEFEIAHLPEAKNVTLDEVRKLQYDEIQKRLEVEENTADIFVICHRGNDSQRAVEILREKFKNHRVRDIIGGYQEWAERINPDFPIY